MARSATKAAGESDVTAAGEETLDFDDVTLRGEKKHVTVDSLYCGHPRDNELVSLIARVRDRGNLFHSIVCNSYFPGI